MAEGAKPEEFGWEILTNQRRIKEGLEWLEPVFENWEVAINRYVEILCDDPPYFYNERPNISLLAAGAWLTGAQNDSPGIALEEYSVKKGTSSGRADLYVCCGRYHCEIEAKQVWFNPGTSGDNLWRGASPNQGPKKREPNTGIHGAYLDAKKLKGTNLSIGICFYPIRLPATSPVKAEVNGKINKMLERIRSMDFDRKGRTIDAMAWSFPTSMRTELIKTDFGNFIYPGLIVALKVARFKGKPV